MKLLRHLFFAVCLASSLLLGGDADALRGGLVAETVDTLIVIAAGDSNGGSGEYYNSTYDTSAAGIDQLKHNFTVVQAQEPLDAISMGANDIGPTTELCQLLLANGHVPAGVVRIVILPTNWAGTGLSLLAGNTGFWLPTTSGGSGYALNGGNGIAVGTGLYGMIAEAKSLYPHNKIWFINWIEGANDGGMSQASWTSSFQALVAQIISNFPDAATAPILVNGIPPDKVNPALGYEVNLGNVIAAQQAIGSNVTNAYYIDPTTPTVLHSYFDNAYVHYNSASHRGGIPNFNLNTSDSIASGSYNSGTGLVTLTLSSGAFPPFANVAPGSTITVSGAAGTGSFASINGTFTAGAGTSGSTLTYTIATGLTMTITNSGSGSVVNTNGWVWNSAVTYNYAGMFLTQTSVVASDGYIYTSLVNGNVGNNPSGNAFPSQWAQQWSTTAAVSSTQSLAYREYQALLSAGF